MHSIRAVVLGRLGSPVFTQKVVLKAQTERKVSQWENRLKVNTGAQVREVCLFSPARLTSWSRLEAGNRLAGPLGQRWPWRAGAACLSLV